MGEHVVLLKSTILFVVIIVNPSDQSTSFLFYCNIHSKEFDHPTHKYSASPIEC